MVQVQSKLLPITVPCAEYVHPWTESCMEAISGCYLYAIVDSFRIYATFYVLALLMRGKLPDKEDLKKTFHGVLQSTAFLSGTAFGYSLFCCSLRRLLGNFNLLTVSAMPAFLASVFAILIERPSRRLLLSLYVSNVATETIWNMMLTRNMVKPVKHGVVLLFSISMASLLYFYKSGLHKRGPDTKDDSMFGVLRFIVGPYEEKDYTARSREAQSFYRQQITPNDPSDEGSSSSWTNRNRKIAWDDITPVLILSAAYITPCRYNTSTHMDELTRFLRVGLLGYMLPMGAGKMAGIGLGIQVALKLILNAKRIMSSPATLKTLFFRKNVLSLALFLGGFASSFRGLNCLLRRITGTDSPYFAIPTGLLAGLAFQSYPDTTVALYVLWKAAQIAYTLGIDRGYLPKVPGFTEFLYCFSTATLFHGALLEPETIRPSYWKFLHSISGGRISCMNRAPLDVWGLNTSEALEKVLKETHTNPVVQFYRGFACL